MPARQGHHFNFSDVWPDVSGQWDFETHIRVIHPRYQEAFFIPYSHTGNPAVCSERKVLGKHTVESI